MTFAFHPARAKSTQTSTECFCGRRGKTECFMRAPRDAWMDSNVFRADFGSGLICPRTETNSEWFMRAPRDAYPSAQTCCASPTQTPAQLANSRRTWSRLRTLKSKCVPSRWKVLSGEFCRRPTTFVINFRKLDRVGRRGLSEPREDFSRLLTYAFPLPFPRLFPWLFPRLLLRRNITAESESRSQ